MATPAGKGDKEHGTTLLPDMLTHTDSSVEDIVPGTTPLHYACLNDQSDAVMTLLKSGADPSLPVSLHTTVCRCALPYPRVSLAAVRAYSCGLSVRHSDRPIRRFVDSPPKNSVSWGASIMSVQRSCGVRCSAPVGMCTTETCTVCPSAVALLLLHTGLAR